MVNVGQTKNREIITKKMNRFVENTSGLTPYCSLLISPPSIFHSPLPANLYHLA